jgi:Predicted acyltransferases
MTEQKADIHYIPELDGVRGIAVLAVMFLHFHAPYTTSRPLGVVSDIILRGGHGVDIFFVLSGFLITSILISTREASNYFQAFYARRALRIFPLAFAMIALFYWVGVPLAHRHGQLQKLPESEQIWYWLFLGNWRQGLGFNDGAELGHFWTLAIEEQFYVLYSLLARYLSKRRLTIVCVTLIASSVMLRAVFVMIGQGGQDVLWRLTPLHMDPIALGALLACSEDFLLWAARWRWPLMVAGVAGMTLSVPGVAILSAGLAATGLVAMAVTRPVTLLRTSILRNCGKYSYGMYVLHPAWIVSPLEKRYPTSMVLMWVCLLAGPVVSYGIAVVSWNVLEKHFLRLKKYFPYRMDPVKQENASLDARIIEPAR